MTIAQTITYGRRALREMEPEVVRALLDQHGIAWVHIEDLLAEVEGHIVAALARGDTVTDAWLQRQYWWDQTLRSIEVEMQRYTVGMAQTLAAAEWQAVTVAQRVTGGVSEYVANEAAKRGITVQGSIRPGVNPGAFERWVVAQQPGSPVREAIDRYGDRVSQSIRVNMTEGLAAGEHPRTIARKITAEVGPDAVEGRIHTITRTETHRAYRGAASDSFAAMQESGAIIGYRWMADLSPRTCPACLAMHNQVFTEYPTSQHVACRCAVSPIPNPAIIPMRPTGKTGDEWLRDQPVAVQRRVLGTSTHYDAFRAGVPLADMVGTKQDSVWGDSIYVRPAKELAA